MQYQRQRLINIITRVQTNSWVPQTLYHQHYHVCKNNLHGFMFRYCWWFGVRCRFHGWLKRSVLLVRHTATWVLRHEQLKQHLVRYWMVTVSGWAHDDALSLYVFVIRTKVPHFYWYPRTSSLFVDFWACLWADASLVSCGQAD